jgi:membrane-bound ClpP family serine protease
MSPEALIRKSTVQLTMTEERPSFREVFRSLNRLPFVMGLLALVAAGGLLVGLVAGMSVVPTPVLVLGTAWMLLLGIVLIILYYRLRE